MLKKLLNFFHAPSTPHDQPPTAVDISNHTPEQGMRLKVYNVVKKEDDIHIDATIFYQDNSYITFAIVPPGIEKDHKKGTLDAKDVETLKRYAMPLQIRTWKSKCKPNCTHNWWLDFTMENKKEFTFPVHGDILDAPLTAKKILQIVAKVSKK